MTLNKATLTAISDDQLCRQSREGDREAFGRIVERYQSLVCSLAYSACGNLSRSEDLAQETFVAAWQKLGELRETSKLRAWLCGIVRNLAAGASRRELRRGGPAESLDLVAEPVSGDADPAALAVTREEETLLWRSLAALPETYREPMVLFYRQAQSVAEVANSLELSEEAVRQRLARGRAMLRAEMTGLVESALARTRPTTAFTVAVLVALPMASASAAGAALSAGVASAGGGAAAGKGVLAKLGLGMFAGPLIGLFFARLGAKAAASAARSAPERECILRSARWIIGYCLAMALGLVAVLSQAGRLYTPSAAWLVLGVGVWTALLVGGILWMCRRMEDEVQRIRLETNTGDEAFASILAVQGRQMSLPKFFESRASLLGLPLFAIAWGDQGMDRRRSRIVCGWLAVGDVAVSPFLAVGGVAVAPVAIGALTVGVLSLSLVWGAAFGVLAVGSLAFGWWALGCAAAGVKCAVGFAAIARDYAVGTAAAAAEAGTFAAKEWVRTQWLADFRRVMVHGLPWWILGCVAAALALRFWRARRESRPGARGGR